MVRLSNNTLVIELEFAVAHLMEKIPLSTAKTNYKLNSLMMLSLGFQPKPYWWDASTLTTSPPLYHPASGFKTT